LFFLYKVIVNETSFWDQHSIHKDGIQASSEARPNVMLLLLQERKHKIIYGTLQRTAPLRSGTICEVYMWFFANLA